VPLVLGIGVGDFTGVGVGEAICLGGTTILSTDDSVGLLPPPPPLQPATMLPAIAKKHIANRNVLRALWPIKRSPPLIRTDQ
jgi:hypothetical protein